MWRFPYRNVVFQGLLVCWFALWSATGNNATGQGATECDALVSDLEQPNMLDNGPVRYALFDRNQRLEAEELLAETSPLRQAAMLQPTPFLEPRIAISESPVAAAQPGSLASRLFETPGLDRSLLRTAKMGVRTWSNDLVRGEEASSLVTTDAGSLLRKSSTSLSVEVQKRSPVVNDPRVRSSRIGALAASGSHWVPAREDLDTVLSKIDSRLVNDVLIVPGPYSSVYGPGFQFVDFELIASPRYAGGTEVHGQTGFNHSSNGNQWLGQQSILAGGSNWGVRADYSHRLGSDYRAGDG